MKLDAETLRKLALSGARARRRELESELEKVKEIERQLTGASLPKPGPSPLREHIKSAVRDQKRRKRRSYTDKFKAAVVKEAREADNASAVGKKHKISPSLVRLWMDKAK